MVALTTRPSRSVPDRSISTAIPACTDLNSSYIYSNDVYRSGIVYLYVSLHCHVRVWFWGTVDVLRYRNIEKDREG